MLKSHTRLVHQPYSQQSRLLLYALVITLVFEGLVRKVTPSAVSIAVFFLKDLLCLYTFTIVVKCRFNGPLAWISNVWQRLSLLLIPSLIYTAFKDWPLGLFAAKQYLLYATVGLLVPLAFPTHRENSFKQFYTSFTWLIVPTTLVALFQNSLPATHWLNMGIDSESLERFSAAGYLRVSSTFSFTGQFSWFLNAVCAYLVISFLSPSTRTQNQKNWLKWLTYLSLGVLFLLGVFVTGGRIAVLGAGACVGLGFLLAGWRTPTLTLTRGILAGTVLYVSYIVLAESMPQYFAAYTARSSGSEKQSHNLEIFERIVGGFTNWMTDFWEQETSSIWLGNGMGVMSNGVDKLSSYARDIRADGTWTETDMATTAWEGGIFLMIVWYAFRFAVIWFCFRRWVAIQNKTYATGAAFLLANITIWGVMSTLAMHPPLAIWWWLSIGSLITIWQFDRAAYQPAVRIQKIIKRHSSTKPTPTQSLLNANV